MSPLEFFVDGVRVGTIESGPPYAVDWTDENPFEKREIVSGAKLDIDRGTAIGLTPELAGVAFANPFSIFSKRSVVF